MKNLITLNLKSVFEEVERLEEFLNELQEKLGFNDEIYARLMLTVSEAVTNGIVHGNKLDESKRVTVRAYQDDGKLFIETKDEGEGFNLEDVPDPLAEENLLKPGGRGVFLMDEHTDDMIIEDSGATITLIFNL